jgi:ATP-dependent Lon protease
MPERNRKDLTEIPEQIRREMEFVFAKKIDELLVQVIEHAEGEDLFRAPVQAAATDLPPRRDDDDDEAPEVRKAEVLEDLPERPTV